VLGVQFAWAMRSNTSAKSSPGTLHARLSRATSRSSTRTRSAPAPCEHSAPTRDAHRLRATRGTWQLYFPDLLLHYLLKTCEASRQQKN
jgi:hypothetical protein